MYVHPPSGNKSKKKNHLWGITNKLKCLYTYIHIHIRIRVCSVCVSYIYDKALYEATSVLWDFPLPSGTYSNMSYLWCGFPISSGRFYHFPELNWIQPTLIAWPGGFITFSSSWEDIMDVSLIYLIVFLQHRHLKDVKLYDLGHGQVYEKGYLLYHGLDRRECKYLCNIHWLPKQFSEHYVNYHNILGRRTSSSSF